MSNDLNIDKLLTVNEHDLESELATCANYYYMFCDLTYDAELEYNQAVLDTEILEANLAKDYKDAFSPTSKTDKLTETEIKRMYRQDTQWLKLKRIELDKFTNFKKMEKAAKAMEMKSNTCMSINKRQIYKAEKGMETI